MLPKKLHKKLIDRKDKSFFRELNSSNKLVDFSSNDYLGFSNSEVIFDKAHQYVIDNNTKQNGATGSRLLSGNHRTHTLVERQLSKVHNCSASLIFNSGYDANIGLLSSVPQRGDIILYDGLVHASMRDGILLSNAKSYKFNHNDLDDLKEKIIRFSQNEISDIYIITESVFSMDGDSPDLVALVNLCKSYKALLIIDEAHALGVFKYSLVQKYNLENDVFARVITFGKALGCHGAAILGSKDLKDYLINFSRSFIYTTALPPHSLATIIMAYEELAGTTQIKKLKKNIEFFKSEVARLKLHDVFINSESAIHCCIIPGNKTVKVVAKKIQKNGFGVKPILSPTVPKGKERIRFCLHSFNSDEEISEVLSLLATFAY